jgi:hypothetical protein
VCISEKRPGVEPRKFARRRSVKRKMGFARFWLRFAHFKRHRRSKKALYMILVANLPSNQLIQLA